MLVSTVAHADTIFGEHTWSGNADRMAERGLRVAKGKHTVSTVADGPIVCAIRTPSGSVLTVGHAMSGKECTVTWKTDETATFTYVVLYNTDIGDYRDSWFTFTYKSEFKASK